MICLLYGKRALPITWLVIKGSKGHLPEHVHLQRLGQLHDLLPPDAQTIFLGDGEFDGIELQADLQAMGLQYVRRTAKNTLLYDVSNSDISTENNGLKSPPKIA